MWGLGAAVRAVDGRGPATSLSTLVPAHFGLRRADRRDRGDLRGPDRRRRVGELAPVVVAAARDGDAVALGLVDDLADELASFATAVDPARWDARG